MLVSTFITTPFKEMVFNLSIFTSLIGKLIIRYSKEGYWDPQMKGSGEKVEKERETLIFTIPKLDAHPLT